MDKATTMIVLERLRRRLEEEFAAVSREIARNSSEPASAQRILVNVSATNQRNELAEELTAIALALDAVRRAP